VYCFKIKLVFVTTPSLILQESWLARNSLVIYKRVHVVRVLSHGHIRHEKRHYNWYFPKTAKILAVLMRAKMQWYPHRTLIASDLGPHRRLIGSFTNDLN
jgi:hypothetical protein